MGMKDPSRDSRQIKYTKAFEAEFDAFLASSEGQRFRYRTDAFAAILVAGCAVTANESARQHLADYQSSPASARLRTNISVTKALAATIDTRFSPISRIIEEKYFMAMCLGLESVLGRPLRAVQA